MAKTVVKAPNKHTARLRCQQSIAGSFMLPASADSDQRHSIPHSQFGIPIWYTLTLANGSVNRRHLMTVIQQAEERCAA